jgi:hypothetical protein
MAIALIFTLCRQSAAASPITGELFQVHGQVTIQGGKPLPAHRIMRFALLHDGDVITLSSGSSALVRLSGNGRCYLLRGRSRSRIKSPDLLSVSGTKPQVKPRLSSADFLPTDLFDRSRETVVVRGLPPSDGPKHPYPLMMVQGPVVMLRWDGEVDPEDAHVGPEVLRVTVRERDDQQPIYQRDLSPEAKALTLPAGLLIPERRYEWSVSFVDASSDLRRACGGPLQILSPTQRAELAAAQREIAKDCAADKSPLRADRLRADADLSFGLAEASLQALNDAVRCGAGPDSKAEAGRLEALLAAAQTR